MTARRSTLLALLAGLAAAAAGGADLWPEGWQARAQVSAAAASANYEVVLHHDGLARQDGRDLRIFGPDQKPVSLFVCYAGPAQARIIFDGSAGTGTYTVFLDNAAPDLPELAGIAPHGRPDWRPTGGYTAISFAGDGRAPRELFSTLDETLTTFRRMQQETAVKEKEEEEKAKQPLPGRFTDFSVLTTTDVKLHDHWYHLLRAEIEMPEAGKIEISVGPGKTNDRFGVLIANGNEGSPAVPGWYTNYNLNFSPLGTAKLGRGHNTLELYTNNERPNLRFRLADTVAPLQPFDGQLAFFHDTLPLTAGPLEYRNDSAAATYLERVRLLIANGQFADARAICTMARTRFVTQPEMLEAFRVEFDNAERAAYHDNWLTDGKYPSRAGAVPDAAFGLPLRQSGASIERFAHEERHLSSSVWVEGQHLYGLPFDVLPTPYQVTSAVSVADGRLLVATKDGVMHAVSLLQESEQWTFPGGGSCLGSPLLYRDVVYYGALDSRLYALDVSSGRMRWNFPVRDWIDGSPCAADGRVFFGSRDGHLYAVDAELGVQRWRTELSGGVSGTPCTDGRAVYVGTRRGVFHALACETGQELWRYQAGTAIDGGACVSGDRLWFGDAAGNVRALDTTSGKAVWPEATAVDGPVVAPPILVGSLVFGGTANGKLWGIDSDSGQLAWQQEMQWGGALTRPPLFAAGQLIFTSRCREELQPGQRPKFFNGGTAIFQNSFRPQLQKIGRCAAPPELDGRPDEDVWAEVVPIGPLLKCRNGAPGDGAMTVRLLWDDTAVYLALRAPAKTGQRSVVLTLDPRRDAVAVLSLSLAADNGMSATLRRAVGWDQGGNETAAKLAACELPANDRDWQPQWQAKAVADDGGWTGELALPFAQLPGKLAAAAKPNEKWRFNVLVRTDDDAWTLSPTYSRDPTPDPQACPELQFE